MKNNLLCWIAILSAAIPTVRADEQAQDPLIISHYRLPAALYEMIKTGLNIPVLIENSPGDASTAPCGDSCFITVGQATLFTEQGKMAIRDVVIQDQENDVRLSDELLEHLKTSQLQYFDNQMNIAITPWSWFTLDISKMRLILHVLQQGYGVRVRPRQFDIDAPTSGDLSGTLAYQFGGYTSRSSQGITSNSGFLNANSVLSKGIDHFIFNTAMYVGNSFSSDRGGRINSALWERDYQGMRYAAGALDSWHMQSIASVTALNNGDMYGFSLGNAADSRKREKSLSLTPVVVFFPVAGEARIYREGKLINIQRFSVGNHEIDTSILPYGFYNVEVEVVSGGKTLSRSPFQINKPFSTEVSSSLRWQLWGGAYQRDKYVDYDNSNKTLYLRGSKQLLSVMGFSLGRNHQQLEWNASGYMLKNRVITELSLAVRILSWFSVNSQGMSASDGSQRTNAGTTLTLPWGIGNAWFNYSKLTTGRFLSLYENKGINWGLSVNVPAVGFYQGGTLTFNEDRDAVYGYRRRRVDYSQSLYSGQYGSLRVRMGLASNLQHQGGRNLIKERYVMLDLSVPLGNAISVGMSHSQDQGTNLNVSASHQFEQPYLKSISVNAAKTLSGYQDHSASGGVLASIDSPFNTNTVSLQTDNQQGWNATLTSQGSLGFTGTHLGAGKDSASAGVLIDTGLQGSEKLALQVEGSSYLLQGNRNYIPLRPYNRYQLALMNNPDDLNSFDISQAGKSNVTLYPGNVVYWQPQVKKIVTVFGRLVDQQGQQIAFRQIKNRFGLTQTESDGRFVIDVDTQHPVLTIETADHSQCSVNLQLQPDTGAQWLGDIACHNSELVMHAQDQQHKVNKS